MEETAEERNRRHVAMARVRGFVHAYDRTDWLLALFISLTTWVLLTVFAAPVLHPEFWSGVAVASGVRPPDSAASGLGLALARLSISLFGVEHGVSALMHLGHVAGALIAGLCFLLMRGSFSARFSIKPEELLVLSPYLRALAVVGAIVFACSEALWIRMQLLSDELICLFLGTVAVVAFDRFRRHRRLGWHCLCSLATGVLAAETPIGFVLAAAIWLWNRRERKRYWARKGALKVLVRDPNDPDRTPSKDRVDAIVSFNEGKADDPAAFFDEELEDEIKRMASLQDAWLAGTVFLAGFVVALVIGGRVFSGLGGLAVEDRTLWGYPVELVVSWYRQMRSLARPIHLLFTGVLSLIPFGLAYALVPFATDAKSKARAVAALLVVLGGAVAWTQLSPFPDCWYWTWDLGGFERASDLIRAIMAFFGAATLMAALQVACCVCRSQVQGVRKIVVEEGAALVRIRRICRGLLALIAFLLVMVSVNGSRQADVRRKLAFVDGYVKAFADQAEGLGWVITDGAFDDALAVELRARGEDEPHPLSMMSGRSAYASYLRARTAVDDEDRRVLRVGTLETLRFWAAERKERLARTGLQLGFEVLAKCRVTDARSAGLMLRIGTSEDDAAFDRADDMARRLGENALAAADVTAFGGFDQSVSDKFDFILWRLARMAELRMNRYLVKEDGASAARERELAKRLDAANGPYLKLKSKLERLGNDEHLVLSPQEGLSVALKRADFNLARPYANRMLRLDPDDLNANFAVGMWAIENRQYGVAAKYLETAREKRPNEPSILNNLAMVRYKLGDLEEARRVIEHAVKVNPGSREIQQNLVRIREAIAKGTATNAAAKATAATRDDMRRSQSQTKGRSENRDAGAMRSRILMLFAALVAFMVVLAGAGWMLSKPKRRKKTESGKKTDSAASEAGKQKTPSPVVEEPDVSNAGKLREPSVPETPTAVRTDAPPVSTESDHCGSDAAYAEKLWNEAREMPHDFIPDFMADRDYLSRLYRAAELGHVMASVKLGDYAYRRGTIVEAYYWTLLANLRGETEVKTALEEIRRKWVQEGFPPEYENVREGFSEQQGVFARAVLRLRCGIDVAKARKRLAELEAAGCKEALLLKSNAV